MLRRRPTLTSELVLFIGKLFVALLATGYYFFMSGITQISYTISLAPLSSLQFYLDYCHYVHGCCSYGCRHYSSLLHFDEEHNNGVAVFASDDMKGFVEDNRHMKASTTMRTKPSHRKAA